MQQSHVTVLGFFRYVKYRFLTLLFIPLLLGLIALGISYLLTPRYTSTTTFIPPQQAQGSAASALAALGPLSALAGVGGNVRTTADQYISLMQSVSVADRIVDTFKLLNAYDVDKRVAARKILSENVRVTLGKKDGIISVEVTDISAQRAAEMANQYVIELRRMTSTLAITEAQQRREFFERQLEKTRDALKQAQLELQSSGISAGTIRAEPKAAAESYARIKAEVAGTEVRLRSARSRLADDTPEVRQLLDTLTVLNRQLSQVEQPNTKEENSDYIGKFRNYKYQEALLEVYARQFELARVDESREGSLIQVIDSATPAELRSFPRRARMAITATLVTFVFMLAFHYSRYAWKSSGVDHKSSIAPAT